jgi:DNA polymerase (family X)
MENTEIARVLSEMADILDLTGGNPFKVRAYRQAAQVIDTLARPAPELLERGELEKLPGIGRHMALHIEELLDRGDFREHQEVSGRVPAGVIEMLQIESLGPKTVAGLWKTLGITDLRELEAACRDQRVLHLPRMGATRVQKILEALERHRARRGRTPLHRALAHADAILARLRAVPRVVAAEAAGSVRRRRETVGDLDLLVATDDAEPVMRLVARLPEAAKTLAEGPTKTTIRLKSGLQVDVRVVRPESFGAALHYFTGSKNHNIALRTRAVRLGLKINEYGVFDREDHRLGGAREEDVFRAVGLPFIPPELREGAGEIEAAEAGTLPRLVEEGDVLGDLHVHSRASADGHSSVQELAAEAERLGRRYLAITDHSRSRPLGLKAEDLIRHAAGIRTVAASGRGKPRLLAGIEVDILGDGALDLPAEALAALDWVVASIHVRFEDPPAQMTMRMVAALESGLVDVIGHPTGRLIGVRDPYEFDLERVLDVARAQGAALEVNAMPDRLDLNDRYCRLAKEAGVPVVISSDAHHASQLECLRYGVWVARRGWLEAKDVVNTRSWDDVARWRRQKRRTALASAAGAAAGPYAPVEVRRTRRRPSPQGRST